MPKNPLMGISVIFSVPGLNEAIQGFNLINMKYFPNSFLRELPESEAFLNMGSNGQITVDFNEKSGYFLKECHALRKWKAG